jgi:hypothetical protein
VSKYTNIDVKNSSSACLCVRGPVLILATFHHNIHTAPPCCVGLIFELAMSDIRSFFGKVSPVATPEEGQSSSESTSNCFHAFFHNLIERRDKESEIPPCHTNTRHDKEVLHRRTKSPSLISFRVNELELLDSDEDFVEEVKPDRSETLLTNFYSKQETIEI